MSFNFDAEVWVIVYPHATGGRFISMCLSLDPLMADTNGQLRPSDLLEQYKEYLADPIRLDAHFHPVDLTPNNSPEFIDNVIHSEKYVFVGHLDHLPFHSDFFKRCKNLKVINISLGGNSCEAISNRRKHFGIQEISLLEKAFYNLSSGIIQHYFGITEHNIITLDFDVIIRYELLKDFFDFLQFEHKLNLTGWEEVYQLWIPKVLKCIEEPPYEYLPPPLQTPRLSPN